jgi:CHAT domain-containing protein
LLADLHAAVGDYRRAARLFRQAETISRATGAASNLASILRGMASAELALGNSAPARAAATEALRLHRLSGEPLEQVDDLIQLAEVDARTGDHAVAAARLREGRAIAARTGVRGARSAIALEAARSAVALGDARGALAALRTIDSTSLALDAGIGWQTGALAARAWAQLDQLDSAVASGRRAVTALEATRGSLPSDMLRSSLVADRADVYADLALALLRLRRVEEAFVVADAARGRELLSHLGVLRNDAATSTAIAPTLRQRAELLQRIDALVERLRRGGSSARPQRGPAAATTESGSADVVAQLAAARDEYEALMSRAAEDVPRPAALLGATSLSVLRLREALEPGELLVEYLLTRQGLLIFAVDRAGVRVEHVSGSQAVSDALVERVRLLRDLWGTPRVDWRTGLAAAWALDSLLAAPLRTHGLLRGVSRLIVGPHGILGQVPFAALQDGTSRRFLVEDVALTVLPSAAALPAVRQLGTGLTGVEGADGFAPFDQQLTASAREMRALHNFASHPRVWTGPRATETALRSALARASVVHVATHGVLDSRNPMFSHIELAGAPGGASANDGRLEVHEVLSLAVRSPLVFVSGCETGVDWKWTRDPVYGSGEPTLAQAFLASGASYVVATLWRIDDVGASMLAERFYARLSRVSVAEALAAAQRDLLKDPRYASPYYWAGFTLSGGGALGADSQFARSASVSRN